MNSEAKNTRNIANIVHDLQPLLKSLQTKLSLLAGGREDEYQKLLKQIKVDALMFEKYMGVIAENEVSAPENPPAIAPPRSVAKVILDLTPLAAALKAHLTALDNAERASDYARIMRLIKHSAALSEQYMLGLEQKCAQFNILKKYAARIDIAP